MVRRSLPPTGSGPGRSRWRYAGHLPRPAAGLAAYEIALTRAGLSPVAGIDEAGRGACAGPLVVAAVVVEPSAVRRMPGLADSKALTPAAREKVYADVVRHAVDWHVVAIPPAEVDASGLHVCNVEGMRRAFAGLRRPPGYVLTDGFPVRGLGAPALAVWKGDQVAASVAAASVLAKVHRDRLMVELGQRYPGYGFGQHKGYATAEHMAALTEFGPCPEHRFSYANVSAVCDGLGARRWADRFVIEPLAGENGLMAERGHRPGIRWDREVAATSAGRASAGTASAGTVPAESVPASAGCGVIGTRRGGGSAPGGPWQSRSEGEHERGRPREVRSGDGAAALS